jgi:hypothetical protein
MLLNFGFWDWRAALCRNFDKAGMIGLSFGGTVEFNFRRAACLYQKKDLVLPGILKTRKYSVFLSNECTVSHCTYSSSFSFSSYLKDLAVFCSTK